MNGVVWMVLLLAFNPIAEASNPRPDRLCYATLVTVLNRLYGIKCCTGISSLTCTNYCEFYTAARETARSTGCGPLPNIRWTPLSCSVYVHTHTHTHTTDLLNQE
jgi:hypothetical protein